MGNIKGIEHHFERVARVYGHVRNTDPDIVEAIIPRLPRNKHRLSVADIGCGTGRYSKIIANRPDANLRLFCCDYSLAMLQQCRKRMSPASTSKNTHFCLVSANDLPFANDCFDVITTFNAVHHFNLDLFIAATARVLRPGGLLSIYTRTPEQNTHTVWGEYFSGFTKRETRLYQRERLEEAINSVAELQLETIQECKHVRVEPIESLVNRARNFHYSTFALYQADEFGSALKSFAKRLTSISKNSTIKHTAKNTMVLVRRI